MDDPRESRQGSMAALAGAAGVLFVLALRLDRSWPDTFALWGALVGIAALFGGALLLIGAGWKGAAVGAWLVTASLVLAAALGL